MALTKMRWSNTGANLIGASARDGANLRSITDPPASRREHFHVYLHAAKTADQATPTGGLPAAWAEGRRVLCLDFSSLQTSRDRPAGILIRIPAGSSRTHFRIASPNPTHSECVNLSSRADQG